MTRALLAVALLVVAVGCGAPVPSVTPAPSVAITTAAPRTFAPSSTPTVAPSATPIRPLGVPGAIALVGNDGSLQLIDAATGTSTVLASADDGTFLFPAWSPDGTHIAAIRVGAETTILVFDATDPTAPVTTPTVVFRDDTLRPFYLDWTPDGRSIAYLVTDSGALWLRLAPVDGSGPLDGRGPATSVPSGNPFFFDWLGDDRLLAHIGQGPTAALGEFGLDGTPPADAQPLDSPGQFGAPVVSPDGRYVGYVRVDAAGDAEAVVAARDGAVERSVPVFGIAALAFDPAGDLLATIGPAEGPTTFPLAVGPIRLLDPEATDEPGAVRTLLDGLVAAFWWSPDGSTIAALRVQPVDTGGVAPSPSGREQAEVRLLFVDVASGSIRSESVVDPGITFIEQFIPYFDQYALSHRLWSPDSAAFLMPIESGPATRVAVMRADGADGTGASIVLDGVAAFWSP